MTLPSNPNHRPARARLTTGSTDREISNRATQPPRLSASSTMFLRAELKRQPEVRPAVIVHARALAADPDYPPMEIMFAVAQQILAAPDLSEDAS